MGKIFKLGYTFTTIKKDYYGTLRRTGSAYNARQFKTY